MTRKNAGISPAQVLNARLRAPPKGRVNLLNGQLCAETRPLSQADCATMVGCTAQTWGNYERGQSTMPPDRFALFLELTR